MVDCGASLSSGNPRNVDVETVAEVDGGGMQVRFRDCGPKVELVSRRTALETAKRISCQMNRKNTTFGESRTVERARSTPLVAVSLRGDEADQVENVPHGNLLPNRFEIDTRQERFSSERFPPDDRFRQDRKAGHREEEPVGVF